MGVVRVRSDERPWLCHELVVLSTWAERLRGLLQRFAAERISSLGKSAMRNFVQISASRELALINKGGKEE